jgi:TPR repeat protein
MVGEGVARDVRGGLRVLWNACERKPGFACAILGEAYATGVTGARDEAMAKRLYRRACDVGVKMACDELGEEVPAAP